MQLTHPTLLGLLIPAAVLLLLLENRLPGTRQRKLGRWAARFGVVAAGLIALAGPYAPAAVPRTQRLVVALDVSTDMNARASREARALLEGAVQAAWAEGIETSVVAFAGTAGPVRTLPAGTRALTPQPPADAGTARAGRPAAGLAGAELAFDEAEVGRILLLTSGRGDPRGLDAALARLRERRIDVQAIAVPREGAAAPAPRPRLVDVRAPEVARGAFRVRVAVDDRGEDVRVRLLVDGKARDAKLLGAGTTGEAHFDVQDLAPGEHELGVALERTGIGGDDGSARGSRVDFARRLITIGTPPRALALLLDPERSDLRRALAAQGLDVRALPPGATAQALTEGPAVDLVVLDAASAAQLDTEAQTVLRDRVRQGLGLLFEAGHDKRAWEA
nr:hypothetical protein [Planctomycetota bacterium]